MARDLKTISKRYNFLNNLKDEFVIIVESIFRSRQPEYGGFRFHKNGMYIGDQRDIEAEYLYDSQLKWVLCFYNL